MKIHVFVATIQGVVAIQRILKENNEALSVICVDNSTTALRISSDYHDFVKRGTGIIQRMYGHSSYRIDVDGQVDTGHSWKLPIVIAHHWHHLQRLGDGKLEAGDRVIWATGLVGADGKIASVEGIREKIISSKSLFEQAASLGIPVYLMLAEENAKEASETVEQILGMRLDPDSGSYVSEQLADLYLLCSSTVAACLERLEMALKMNSAPSEDQIDTRGRFWEDIKHKIRGKISMITIVSVVVAVAIMAFSIVGGSHNPSVTPLEVNPDPPPVVNRGGSLDDFEKVRKPDPLPVRKAGPLDDFGQ